ncbi:hypothetical protein CTT30_08835 [Vibrio coralliilyticus]|nr:hypothetical protein CTT30_08835 [Vibrio coralliilyticus]
MAIIKSSKTQGIATFKVARNEGEVEYLSTRLDWNLASKISNKTQLQLAEFFFFIIFKIWLRYINYLYSVYYDADN